MKISKISDEHFSNYNMLPNGNEEIDLFDLIRVLWAAKIKIVGVILFFACIGFLVSFVLPQKWTSSAVVTPAESVQWSELIRSFPSFMFWEWILISIVIAHLLCLLRNFSPLIR